MKVIFTICSNNYLAQAITLGESLTISNKDYNFYIFLIDKKDSAIDYSKIPFTIIEINTDIVPHLSEMIKRYSIIELNTSVKPFIFCHFFKNANIEHVTYLDPDIYVYQSLSNIDKELINNDIILVPHIISTLSDDKIPNEPNFLNSGLYNLGYVTIKNSENGFKIANWWAEKLRYYCFIDFENGLFTDQLWMNFVPIFFKNVSILKNIGFNMAYWNLHERVLSKNDTAYIVNNKEPLIFFHFSGYNPLIKDYLSKYQNRVNLIDNPILKDLFYDYASHLLNNKYEYYRKLNCYYTVDKIKKEAISHERKRKLYLKNLGIAKRIIRRIIKFLIRKLNLDMNL